MKMKLSGTSGVTGTPLVMMYISPRPILSVPSVAINGGNWIHVIRKPLKAPAISPAHSPARIAGSMVQPCWNASAVISDDKPITEPTDRSMPPVMITSIIPIDMMPTSENERNTPIRLLVVRKYGEKILIAIPTRMSTDRMLSSRIFSPLRIMSSRPARGGSPVLVEMALKGRLHLSSFSPQRLMRWDWHRS